MTQVDWPERQLAWDLAVTTPFRTRVERVELSAQVTQLDRVFGTLPADAWSAVTLAIVPEAHEAQVMVDLQAGKLGPGSGEGKIGDVWAKYEGLAIVLPMDRRIVSVRVPIAAIVFVFDKRAQAVSGLLWTRPLAGVCGCKG